MRRVLFALALSACKAPEPHGEYVGPPTPSAAPTPPNVPYGGLATIPDPAPTRSPEAAALSEKFQQIWRDYDNEPQAKKTKKRLGAAADATADLVGSASDKYRAELGAMGTAAYRKRMPTFVRPPCRSTGVGYKTFVPSDNLAECLVWGSQWSQGETADAMKSMGFTEIRCANGRHWEL